MKRFLRKLLVGGFGLVGFIFLYGSFCDYFFKEKSFLDLSDKKHWILAQAGGNYDYAILGSSRAYGAFNMNMLDSLTNQNGINLGSDGSGFKDNLLILNLFLKNNTIDRLYLQVDLGSLNSKESFSNEFHGFTFLPYWEDPKVRQILKDEILLFDNQITSIFPQWRYLYYNKYYSPKQVFRRFNISASQPDLFTSTKGGKKSSSVEQRSVIHEIKLKPQLEKVSPDDIYYFREILDLTRSNQIQTTLFVAPIYHSHNQAYLRSVISKYPNSFIFPDQFDEFDSSLFEDQNHLSETGRRENTYLFSMNFN